MPETDLNQPYDATSGIPPESIFRLRIRDVPCVATPGGHVRGYEIRAWALAAFRYASLQVHALDSATHVKDYYGGCSRCHFFAAVSLQGANTASGAPTWCGLTEVQH